MNTYSTQFASLKKQNRIGFCPFAVLGHPDEKTCMERIKKYLAVSPNFLELGIPFSDPVADGPVIQKASTEAIKNGLTPRRALKLIAKIRKLTKIPIGILTYANIVYRYGIEKFYSDAKKSGADSILIADVPLEEIKPFSLAAKKNGISQVLIISEKTDPGRLKQISKISNAFLYAVSTLGVTGARKSLNRKLKTFIRKTKKLTRVPVMVGFGISNSRQIQELQKIGANGAIVGSLLVKTPTSKLPKTLNSLLINQKPAKFTSPI